MDHGRKIPITARVALIYLVAFGSGCPSAAQERIIAVGDVHRSVSPFTGILQQAGLIDPVMFPFLGK